MKRAIQWIRWSGAVVIVALAVGATAASATEARPHKIFVPRSIVSNQLAFRPHRIYLSGDGTFWVERLRWRRYGGRAAVATGMASISSCEPNCVEGSRYHLPAKVRLTKVIHCRGSYFYSRLRYSLYGHLPVNIRRRRSLRLQLVNEFLEPVC